MSSSVPSSAFVMQHLRNDRLMVSVEMAFQLSRIHWQIWRRSGFRMRPAGVNVWFPASIHSFQYCLKLSLKGLLTPTSKGCKRLVIPPGITATSVREFFKTWIFQNPLKELNQRLSCLWKQLETQNRRFLIDWSRSVKWRWQVCSGCLWRTWHRWEENCWTFTNGIQQNCILFYRKRWWNFLQSDWKKEALERPTRRNGYSVQAVLDIFKQETR